MIFYNILTFLSFGPYKTEIGQPIDLLCLVVVVEICEFRHILYL